MKTDIHHAASAPGSFAILEKVSAALAFAGLGVLCLSVFKLLPTESVPWAGLSIGAIFAGVAAFTLLRYLPRSAGIKNDHIWHNSLSSRGLTAWVTALAITIFYIALYFFPEKLGLGENGSANTGLVRLFDPLSLWLKGSPASQWFVYGVLYTLAILAFGIKFILKYRHNPYQKVRTFSVMFFQLGFAFLLPEILLRLNYPYYDLKNMWPLNYYFFDEWNIRALSDSGIIGMAMIALGIAMIFIISPLLTYHYGKRWYCSWVCGCGGLAETAGDPFRHLSDKSVTAWKVERWMVHGVLLFSLVMTGAVIYSYLHANPDGFFMKSQWLLWLLVGMAGTFSLAIAFLPTFRSKINPKDRKWIHMASIALIFICLTAHYGPSQNLFFVDSGKLRAWYGFYIGACFSGVIGVGFYPLMGSRVWCRFGCPMAAILGIQQKLFSKFRITTNGGQCISCGNCSSFCEMGIDVRAYAQKGEHIVRASCVGCGICAAVCPRGVLRLENGRIDLDNRIEADLI